jgi:hypothetical protein
MRKLEIIRKEGITDMLHKYDLYVNGEKLRISHGTKLTIEIPDESIEVYAKIFFYSSRRIILPAKGDVSLSLYSLLPKKQMALLFLVIALTFIFSVYVPHEYWNDFFRESAGFVGKGTLAFLFYNSTIGYKDYIKVKVNALSL